MKMSGKRLHRAAAWLLIGALTCSDATTMYAATVQEIGKKPAVEAAVSEETAEEKIPRQTDTLTMTPGSSYLLDFKNAGKDDKIKIVSDAPAVVSANRKGKLKANRCGKASVLITIRHKKKVRQVELKVTVKYDRYLETKSYGKGFIASDGSSAIRLDLHRQLTKGKAMQMRIGGLEKNARVRYHSSNPAVASVDAAGKVRAKADGKSVIKCTVVQNKKTYFFYEDIHVSDTRVNEARISDKERNAWFSDAGFIGNSIGVGQKMYFDSQGKGYLGNPVMMVRGCYSFANDASSSNEYKITYKGRPYKARTVVKLSGVKKLFINMGTNDLWQSPANVYKRYVDYLDGIRKDSPGVVIFIESTTPVASGHGGKGLCNANVNKLNLIMQAYCASQPDMYYIDVNSCLKGSDGCLKPSYTSDRYVHLTMSGYAQWMSTLCAYTDQLMIAQNRAEDAVKTVEESLDARDYECARELARALELGKERTDLLKRLKNIKSRLKKSASVSSASGRTVNSVGKQTSAPVINEEKTDAEENVVVRQINSTVIRQVKAKNNTQLRLIWEKRKGAGYYEVYRSAAKHGTYKKIGGTTEHSYVDTKCKKNTKYYYKVRALASENDRTGESKLSKAMSGHTRNVPKKVVFAGDSIMSGLSAYGLTKEIHIPGKKRVVAYKGLGTLTFQTSGKFHGETGVDTVVAWQPDRLYLMLGMNEIEYRKMDDMLQNYSEILEQLQDESPKTEIVLLSVSPVTKSVETRKKGFVRISRWNKKVEKLAAEYGCHYFSFADAMKDSNGYLKYGDGDGIHWTVSGYRTFISQIEACDKKLNR